MPSVDNLESDVERFVSTVKVHVDVEVEVAAEDSSTFHVTNLIVREQELKTNVSRALMEQADFEDDLWMTLPLNSSEPDKLHVMWDPDRIEVRVEE